MKKKYFTPFEANRRLPLVKKIVADILEKGQQLRRLIKESPSGNIPQEAYAFQSQIEGLMLELEDLGCYFKDWNFEIGLVDFPALIDGKEVLLCWKSDEPSLTWYHSLEDGFAGRARIPQELLVGQS